MSHIAPLPFRPDAIIFDMDGLMLETERIAVDCLVRSSSHIAPEIEPQFWRQMIGLGDVATRERTTARIGAERSRALLARSQEYFEETIAQGIPHRPGLLPLLDYLTQHDVPHAVATSSNRSHAERKLQIANLNKYFAVVCTASDVERPKPDPAIYLLATRRLGVDPQRCVALEDSPVGVQAVLAAGITPIQIPDLIKPTEQVLAYGHRIVASLKQAQELLVAVIGP